jgi:hypothetical protein
VRRECKLERAGRRQTRRVVAGRGVVRSRSARLLVENGSRRLTLAVPGRSIDIGRDVLFHVLGDQHDGRGWMQAECQDQSKPQRDSTYSRVLWPSSCSSLDNVLGFLSTHNVTCSNMRLPLAQSGNMVYPTETDIV